MTSPMKKVSRDGLSIAIRTRFSDAPLGPMDQTRAFLVATHGGITGYLSEADVADWYEVHSSTGEVDVSP